MSQKLHWSNWFRFLCVIVFILYAHLSSANKNVSATDTLKIKQQLSLIDKFIAEKKQDSILVYAEQAHEWIQQLKQSKKNSRPIELFILRSYIALADQLRNTRETNKVEKYYFEALSFAKSKKFTNEECIIVGKLGMYYYNESDYPSALNYSFQNLKLAESLNDKMQMAIAYNRIGIVYKRQMDHEKAIKAILQSVDLFEELGDKARVANSINNIGDVYFNQKNYQKAFANYKAELAIGLNVNEPECIADAYSCMALVYSSIIDLPKDSLTAILGTSSSGLNRQSLLDSAEFYLNKAIVIYKKLNDTYEISDCLNGMGKILQLKGRNKEALDVYGQAYTMSAEFGYMEKQKEACYGIFENYQALGKAEQSLQWYMRYTQINDSIFNISKAKDLGRLESKHEYDAKEKQITADRLHERELAAAEKKQQQFILIIVCVGLLLVISLLVYLFSRFRLIKRQNLLIEMQKKIMQEKQKEIADSINYAERIQRSFLASGEELSESFGNYFVMFQPKDVVSGDFYWASKLSNGNIAYCCADSTGHGVPGAIMSVLNISSLEKSIETNSTSSAILNATRKIIIERLKKDGTVEGGKDGMDCALIILNREKTKLQCAAANSPVWILRKGEIIEILPDKMPVGKHERDQVPFTQHEFDLEKGDLIYALTDGMPDQFGGPKGKKYKYTQLKKFISSISDLPLNEQKEKLEEEFNHWKGDLEQTDDVCIIGVKI